MIKIVDGKPVHVPDDERITPQLVKLRDIMNHPVYGIGPFLRAMEKDIRENGPIMRAYREGVISREPGFNWYADPHK